MNLVHFLRQSMRCLLDFYKSFDWCGSWLIHPFLTLTALAQPATVLTTNFGWLFSILYLSMFTLPGGSSPLIQLLNWSLPAMFHLFYLPFLWPPIKSGLLGDLSSSPTKKRWRAEICYDDSRYQLKHKMQVWSILEEVGLGPPSPPKKCV